MKIKKVLKILGIIILIIIVLVLIHGIRNTMIIRNLQNEAEKYSNSNNFHIKATTQIDKNTTLTINQYKKNEKQLVVLERIKNGEKIKMSYYDTGDRIDLFVDAKDEKKAELGKVKEISGISLTTPLQTDNLWQTIIYGLVAQITTVNVNGYECYSINNFFSPYSLSGNSKTEYNIEKETGLARKIVLDEQITIREYEFENVDDSVFIEPDMSEYIVEEY